jgi:periplasmic divalent cation tolerance protein
MAEAVILYTTWPNADTAEAAAGQAVEAGLCACVNISGPIRSLFRWKGKPEQAAETQALFKTTSARVEALKAFILERHPYDLPCVVALPIGETGSHPSYLAWIEEQTASALD